MGFDIQIEIEAKVIRLCQAKSILNCQNFDPHLLDYSYIYYGLRDHHLQFRLVKKMAFPHTRPKETSTVTFILKAVRGSTIVFISNAPNVSSIFLQLFSLLGMSR